MVDKINRYRLSKLQRARPPRKTDVHTEVKLLPCAGNIELGTLGFCTAAVAFRSGFQLIPRFLEICRYR